MRAFRYIGQKIEEEGLVLSAEKSGILTTDKEVEKWIKSVRKEHEPQVCRVMKDLGIDATAGRCRRIPTVRKRLKKGQASYTKLLRLRVGSRACKIRLIKGSIHAVVAYGADGLGVPPQRMRAYRMPLAQTIGWQRGGSLDVIYCQNDKVEDPMTTTMVRHLLAIQRLVKQWPEDKIHVLEEAWANAWEKLEGAIHPWKVAYGPLQASICYLMQMGWQAKTLWRWTKGDVNTGQYLNFGLNCSAWELEMFFKCEMEVQAESRLRRSLDCQVKQTAFDWTVLRKMMKEATALQKAALLAWHQGSLRTKDNSDMKECPVCKVELTAKHLIWQCKWINDRCRGLPDYLEVMMETDADQELWIRGWTHVPMTPVRIQSWSCIVGELRHLGASGMSHQTRRMDLWTGSGNVSGQKDSAARGGSSGSG